jgi:hypothetical protein
MLLSTVDAVYKKSKSECGRSLRDCISILGDYWKQTSDTRFLNLLVDVASNSHCDVDTRSVALFYLGTFKGTCSTTALNSSGYTTTGNNITKAAPGFTYSYDDEGINAVLQFDGRGSACNTESAEPSVHSVAKTNGAMVDATCFLKK